MTITTITSIIKIKLKTIIIKILKLTLNTFTSTIMTTPMPPITSLSCTTTTITTTTTIADSTVTSISSASSSSTSSRRQRHGIAGQMSYMKMLGFGGFSKKMATSANSLFSTAVISGSSSAPNLRDMIPVSSSGFGDVPPIRPLETLHNALSLKKLDNFLSHMTTMPLFKTPTGSPPHQPSTQTQDGQSFRKVIVFPHPQDIYDYDGSDMGSARLTMSSNVNELGQSVTSELRATQCQQPPEEQVVQQPLKEKVARKSST